MEKMKADTVHFCSPHLSLKKEKNPFPPSPLALKDLLLWSPAFSFSRSFSLFLSSSRCSTCWLITNLMSSCNIKNMLDRIKNTNTQTHCTRSHTCQASSSWDSATLCLMVLSNCWVSDSFSWSTVANSLSNELGIDIIISSVEK